MKLLLGLYPVTEGEIWLLPENREGMKLEGINPYVSYVPQDDFLFDDTIYQNIQYGETAKFQANQLEKITKEASKQGVKIIIKIVE